MYKTFLQIRWHMALCYHSSQSSGSSGITKPGPTWVWMLASIIELADKENSSHVATFSYCSKISVTITYTSGLIRCSLLFNHYNNFPVLKFHAMWTGKVARMNLRVKHIRYLTKFQVLYVWLVCQNLPRICTLPIDSSINKLTKLPQHHYQKLTGLLYLRLVSEACQIFMSAWMSIECHWSVCTGQPPCW